MVRHVDKIWLTVYAGVGDEVNVPALLSGEEVQTVSEEVPTVSEEVLAVLSGEEVTQKGSYYITYNNFGYFLSSILKIGIEYQVYIFKSVQNVATV